MNRLFLLTLAVALFAAPSAAQVRPNFVVILCDDLGWGDLQNYGHPHIETPNLVRMADEGIRFTNFYSAAPVCSPSRVGLLTGRTPNRAGVYDWIPNADPNRPPRQSRALVQMRDTELTIPSLLKTVGYATCMSGKWHCNAMFNSDKQAQPGDHGFDHWFATQNNASPSHENPKNFVRNGQVVGELEGFSCQLVADEFIDWLRTHKRDEPDQPFFGYVAYHEPHEPVASPADLVEKYKQKGARNNDEAHYFANVENLDAATGRILKTLDDLGYGKNTLVIFTSDNGPETLNRYRSANRSYGTPGKLRGMKLHTHEAGYRVAGIMRWPDQIDGGQISSEPVCSLDFLPTFAKLARADFPKERTLDGADFFPALFGKPIRRERPLMWVYYHSYTEQKRWVPSVSMRDGDMKVRAVIDGFDGIVQVDESNVDMVRAGELSGFELYDLSKDPSESRPLPIEGSPLPEKLRKQYNDALQSFLVWPAVKGR
ncbi:MAG: sulfatase-like hydrolase/transferase [Planctomycetota bacterium]